MCLRAKTEREGKREEKQREGVNENYTGTGTGIPVFRTVIYNVTLLKLKVLVYSLSPSPFFPSLFPSLSVFVRKHIPPSFCLLFSLSYFFTSYCRFSCQNMNDTSFEQCDRFHVWYRAKVKTLSSHSRPSFSVCRRQQCG